jgi:hypothetical protein
VQIASLCGSGLDVGPDGVKLIGVGINLRQCTAHASETYSEKNVSCFTSVDAERSGTKFEF